MATLPADSLTAYEWCVKETIASNGENFIYIHYNVYKIKFTTTNGKYSDLST